MPTSNVATTSHSTTQDQAAPQPGTGSRFCSWAEICLASVRLAPTSDDFNHWPAYGVSPVETFSEDMGRYDGACRICRELEKSGKHKGNVYKNHYGNYPTHCPRWAEMTNKERGDIALAAHFCIHCMNPKHVFKSRNESQKHMRDECYMRRNGAKNK